MAGRAALLAVYEVIDSADATACAPTRPGIRVDNSIEIQSSPVRAGCQRWIPAFQLFPCNIWRSVFHSIAGGAFGIQLLPHCKSGMMKPEYMYCCSVKTQSRFWYIHSSVSPAVGATQVPSQTVSSQSIVLPNSIRQTKIQRKLHRSQGKSTPRVFTREPIC